MPCRAQHHEMLGAAFVSARHAPMRGLVRRAVLSMQHRGTWSKLPTLGLPGNLEQAAC